MKRSTIVSLILLLATTPIFSQIILLNEDFGAAESFASANLEALSNYDLDPVAQYLDSETAAINYYGADNTSEGAYDGASGGNFFLLSNNWNENGLTFTWANMDVSAYSEMSIIEFGMAFSGGPNAAWTGTWLFSLEYSFDDVVSDPENADWYGIDLKTKATGWPDPLVAGGDNWSKVAVDAGVNLLGEERLSVRIKSNGNFDYHFDDFKITVKTPTSGMERVSIAKETFGPSEFYRGPANEYENYSNNGKMKFNDYQVHYQNYGSSFQNTYPNNSIEGNWWLSSEDEAGVAEDTLVFSVNTVEYSDIQLQFGFTYWGGVPGSMVGVYYTTDSITWFPVTTVSPATSYPGTNQETLDDGYFHLVRYDDLLPRHENLTIKIYQATAARFIMDDIELTGVYQPLSSDASLSEISFTGVQDLVLDPEFNRETFSYSVLLPPGTEDVPAIEAITTDTAAEYFVEPALDIHSDEEADRQSYIYVTAADGETRLIYTLTFNVEKSSDATLKEIQIDGQSLEEFDPGTTEYDFILASDASTVPNVTATVNHAEAWMIIEDADELPGTTTIEVTAEDGTSVTTYSINFQLAPTGISDNPASTLIYPVPVRETLNIRSGSPVKNIRITDISGKIVFNEEVKGEKLVSLNPGFLAKGLYFLEITGVDNESEVFRFVKR